MIYCCVNWFCWMNTKIASFIVVFDVIDLDSSGSLVSGLVIFPRRNHDTIADLSYVYPSVDITKNIKDSWLAN